jgi:heme-degrading monooxygenase HmoA
VIHIVWEFVPRTERKDEFETTYGSAGAWAVLFARDSSFAGTTLLRQQGECVRYLTIDRWASRDSFQAFKRRHAAAYAELDQRCAELTERETLVGVFEEPGS